MREEVEETKKELANAHCGGWVPFEKMEKYSVTDYIANTSGIPGRNGAALEDVTSGMAVRDATLEFPETVSGISTACRPGNPPFLEEHACQRPAGEPVFGDGEHPKKELMDQLGNGVRWTCNALESDLNRRWKRDRWDITCPNPPDGKKTTSEKSNCYDIDYEDRPAAPDPPAGCTVSTTQLYCCTYSETAPNAVLCSGEECRGEQETVSGFKSEGDPYVSYFRRYEGSCDRTQFPEVYVPQDNTYSRVDVPVACYGFYNEYDPLDTVSEAKNYSCVINNYEAKAHSFAKADVTQRSKMSTVEYGQNMRVADPPSSEYTLSRIPENDLWYPLNGGFSLTNEEVFREDYGQDLTYVLLSPDNAKMRAYPQISLKQPISTGALLRAFDDTKKPEVDGRRFFTEWWQEVQTEMDQLLTPPKVRLILPHPATLGLDRNDQFIANTVLEILTSAERPESVEVLLEAREDLLGELAAYFERSALLRIQEEEVPLVVPIANPMELRAMADSWCTWHMETSGEKNCDAIPQDVQNIRDWLNGLADYTSEIRILRNELHHYESALLERQKNSIRFIHNWLKDIVASYEEYQNSIQDLQAVRTAWADVQAEYSKFIHETNMPWCMNTRFTTPIYSLLDDWYPGRPLLDGGIDTEIITTSDITVLPRLDIFPPQADPSSPYDVRIDFSHFFIANNPLQLPVLKPIQVRLDWSEFSPPAPDGDLPGPLPPLPTIPTIYERVEDSWPKVTLGEQPPVITTYIPQTAEAVDLAFLPRVQTMFKDMAERYAKYWDSIVYTPKIPGTAEDCISPDTVPCTHVEMDLKERFQRMCARPAVLLKEDFEARGSGWIAPEIYDYDNCPREDWACQTLWRKEVYERKGWTIVHPEDKAQQTLLDTLRSDMFYDTLLLPGVSAQNRLKFIVNPSDIIPSLGITHTGSLLPAPSTPSS